MRRLVCAVVFVAVLAVAPGCGINARTVTPTPDVIRQIGLPLYPHARPLNAMRLRNKAGPMTMDSLVATFATDDDVERTAAFYAKALPRAKRSTAPFGGMVRLNIQEINKRGPSFDRAVSISPMKNGALIQLMRMTMEMPTPAPSGGS